MIVEMDGRGTAEEPYRISCVEELRAIKYRLDAHYRLISNLDATNTKQQEFKPIGDRDNPFTGTFDGNNHEIRNFSSKKQEHNVGLFGCVGKGGQIENLGLTGVSITGIMVVGGLVGRNFGKIESSYVQGGTISGNVSVGGLVGRNSGEIESSYVQGGDTSLYDLISRLKYIPSSDVVKLDVSGVRSIGGLVGTNIGDVVWSSVLKSDVSGERYVGGLFGRKGGKVEYSYTVDNNISGDEEIGICVGRNLGCVGDFFNMSNSYEPNITEKSDLIMSRKNHRILYDVETGKLYIQVGSEIYSYNEKELQPTSVQFLVNHHGV